MKTLKFLTLPILMGLLFVTTSATNDSKETERVRSSTAVIREFGRMKETIPHDLIAEYQGIVIVPRLLNAGFGIGANLVGFPGGL